MQTLIKSCVAGVHQKFSFFPKYTVRRLAVIRNADFRESPRELCRKSACFFWFVGGVRAVCARAFIRSAASADGSSLITHLQLSEMPFTRSLKPAKYPPHTSFDGRSPTSKMWGKRYGLVTMCPHIKHKAQGGDGRQCGLQRQFCMCLCPRCCTPLRARKQCSNSNCRWGLSGSPDASTPEESPEVPQSRRRRSAPEPHRNPTVSHPRGSLQVFLHLRDRRTFAKNPPPAHTVSPRPKRVPSEARPVTWHRTAYAMMPKALSLARPDSCATP
jgi:hypothetical protein